MINLPSDSFPKFLAFLGLAILIPCGLQAHNVNEDVRQALLTLKASQAEWGELASQDLDLLRQSAAMNRQALESMQEAYALTKASRASDAAAKQAVAESMRSEAVALGKVSEDKRRAAEKKQVDVARELKIVETLLGDAHGRVNYYGFGMLVGVILFCFGASRWIDLEKVKKGPAPLPVRRVTKRRS